MADWPTTYTQIRPRIFVCPPPAGSGKLGPIRRRVQSAVARSAFNATSLGRGALDAGYAAVDADKPLLNLRERRTLVMLEELAHMVLELSTRL